MKRVAGLFSVLALVFTVACGETDAGITTSVKSALAADETVKAYQIDVDTSEGVVTLSGAVETADAKRQAVLVAREAAGVRDVVDNIVIGDAVATSGTDVDDRTEAEIREGADATADSAERAGDAARRGTENIGYRAEDGARDGADAIGDGARRVGDAAKRGAEATADGAKKVGTGIRDAVTGRDADRDGR